MSQVGQTATTSLENDSRPLWLWYSVLALLCLLPIAVYFLGYFQTPSIMAMAGLVFCLLVLHPRVGFVLFVLSLGWSSGVWVGGFVVTPSDVLVLVLVLAVLLDFLLRGSSEVRVSQFDLPFLGLALATYVSIPFAHDMERCLTPAVRIAVIYIAFRISFKLACEMGVGRIVRWYLLLVTALSVANLTQFATSGGQGRVFGLAWLTFETLSMTALPMAVALGLWTTKRSQRLAYGLAASLILLALMATGSRAPLLAVVGAVPLVIFFHAKWRKHLDGEKKSRSVLVPILAGAVAVAAIPLLAGDLFGVVLERLEELVRSTDQAEGTVALRIVLWTAAVKAFLANPITGIGIGNFRVVDQVVPSVRMEPVWYYIRGMSAHNVILQYLAETGLVGALSLVWLAIAGVKTSYRSLFDSRKRLDAATGAAILIAMCVFAVTILYMRAWTWGLDGYVMALLFGLAAAHAHGTGMKAGGSRT